MDNQEAFDKMIAHLSKQNWEQSLINDHDDCAYGNCAYRGLDGKMCAIGCLIPDEIYKTEMEGLGVDIMFDSGESLFKGVSIELLELFQTFHDDTMLGLGLSGKINWLRNIARRYGLEFKENLLAQNKN